MGGDYLAFATSWHTVGIVFSVVILLMLALPLIGNQAGRFGTSLLALVVLVWTIATTPVQTWLEWLTWLSAHWWIYIVVGALLLLGMIISARRK
jgi:hypothetical protein